MNKDKALDILKTINYPGFNRDIVSFGMVQNVSVAGNNITVKLNINTQNEEKKRTIIKLVENKILSIESVNKNDSIKQVTHITDEIKTAQEKYANNFLISFR